MKNDMKGREDIELLVNSFYLKVRSDEVIGYLFNEVARVNWDHHLPVMYDFWQKILFNEEGYKGNPMPKHLALHQQSPLNPAHFERWVNLFVSTIDELFEGDYAELAKQRARSIATVMQIRVLHQGIGLNH